MEIVKENKIPQQLQKDSFGFVKLLARSKKPFEQNWQNKPYSYSEIQLWFDQGNNYGVLGGRGDLVIIDADALEITAIVEEKFPDAEDAPNVLEEQMTEKNKVVGAVIFTDGQADDKNVNTYLSLRNKDFQLVFVGVGSRGKYTDVAITSINAPARMAIDTACKAANVDVVGKEKLGGGYVTIVIKGELSAVTAAVEAGREKVEGLGILIAAHVLARPSSSVLALLPKTSS